MKYLLIAVFIHAYSAPTIKTIKLESLESCNRVGEEWNKIFANFNTSYRCVKL
jgi:hypothetical protein